MARRYTAVFLLSILKANISNEWYAKNISKKCRILNKMKGNSGFQPYGYIKNPDDPRFWVIDPDAASVVRRIYQMALDGYGLAETAAALEQDGVLNPTYYWRSKKTNWGSSKSTLGPYHHQENSHLAGILR